MLITDVFRALNIYDVAFKRKWLTVMHRSWIKAIKDFHKKHRHRCLQSNFIEITLRHGCSPVNLLHIFRTPFFKTTSGWLLLDLLPLHSTKGVFLKIFKNFAGYFFSEYLKKSNFLPTIFSKRVSFYMEQWSAVLNLKK